MALQLPRDLWEKVLEFARPAEVFLPRYPSFWRHDWVLHAFMAHFSLRAAAREALELALLFRSDAAIKHLREQELLAFRYWLYLCRYRDIVELYNENGDEDEESAPEPFFVLFSPLDLERLPVFVSDYREPRGQPLELKRRS